MFEIAVEETFAAGHALRGYKGKCEHVHGHNYKVRVTLAGGQLDQAGLLYDFVELKRSISQVINALDHKFLNDLPPFDRLNPSAENIAKYFYGEITQQLAATPNGARIKEITIFETDTTTATYRPA
ncbi:MAG: 6-carboxytetrahydropterin synthase QueD [Terriglobia bacterium]